MNLHCEILGGGTPVLLLHGYGVDHRLMSGCFEPVFAKAPSYKRFYPDLPGMGQSPAGDVKSADDMLAALVEFIEAEMPPGPFLLAGESYGGYMSLGLLALMPKRILGVCLLCAAVQDDHAKRRLPKRQVLADTLGSGVEKELAQKFDTYAVQRTQEALRLYQRDVLPGIEAGDKAFIKRYHPGRYPYKTTPRFTYFGGPSLILAGRQDDAVGYEDAYPLLEKMPRASYAVLDMAGHNLQTEQPALFEALAADWLARVAQATG